MAAYQGDEDGWAALGDPTRRAIVASLAERPRAVGELAAELPVSRPAVSQALKVLKDAGLVNERAVGTRRIYRLRRRASSSSPSRTRRRRRTSTSRGPGVNKKTGVAARTKATWTLTLKPGKYTYRSDKSRKLHGSFTVKAAA